MESLSEEELLQFLRAEGGRAKNSDLLTRYQSLISHADPQLRAHHRQTFKEIINKVAVVKQEDGEKYVILKKRHQPLISDLASTGEMLATVDPTMFSKTPLPTSGMVLWESGNHASQPSVEVPSTPVEQASPKEKNHGAIPRIHVKDFSTVLQSYLTAQKTGLHAVGGAHHLQRQVNSPDSPKGRGRRFVSSGLQDEEEADDLAKETEQEVFEDGGSSVGTASVALDPMEKEWLQGAACGNVTVLSQLLKQEPTLAGKRDFTSGFTALHWAAKHGKTDMVMMLVNAGAEINIRDHGGYTPLHIAAFHGHREIMNLLIYNYGAKDTVRDYSGRLPAQYLKPNGPRDAANDASLFLSSLCNPLPSASLFCSPRSPFLYHMTGLELRTLLEFHQARGERRNRKLASLFTAKSSSHSKKRWGSAEDLVEEEEEEEKGNPHHLALPTSYLPVRKFSR